MTGRAAADHAQAARALLFTAVFPGTVLGVVPAILLRLDPVRPGEAPAWLRVAGLAAMGAGTAGYAVCVREFALRGRGTPAPWDPPAHLVGGGLYRRTRNPMYVSVLLFLAGEVLLFASPLLAAYGLLVFALFHLTVVLYEERVLRWRFRDPYARYLREVPRWLGRRREGR